MEDDYNKFKNGEKLIHKWHDTLIDKDDKLVVEHPKEYYTYNEWCENELDLEPYHETFTTPNGEKIVIFGEYGHD
jgi:hypothetical protein